MSDPGDADSCSATSASRTVSSTAGSSTRSSAGCAAAGGASIEAVTGSGKTDVAIAAIADALRRGRFVLVVVPSRVLMEQWHGRLAAALPEARIGRLGDSGTDRPADLRRARRHPPLGRGATSRCPRTGVGGLLVADECHGLGGGTLRRAMLPQYEERLGLTATLERSDDAVTELLLPYFGGICHRYGFEQAIADGVCAAPACRVRRRASCRSTSGPSTPRPSSSSSSARNHLRRVPRHAARAVRRLPRRGGAPRRARRGRRRSRRPASTSTRSRSGARSSPSRAASTSCSAAWRRPSATRDGALVFTETVRAANHAINRLDPLVSIDLITGVDRAPAAPRDPRRPARPTARRGRRAPRARRRHRRARRQPRHRDEREPHPAPDDPADGPHPAPQAARRRGPLRDHVRQGHAGGPDANRIERDGFLDEIERISEATGVFDGGRFDALDAFLAAAGPDGRARTRAPRALRAGGGRRRSPRRGARPTTTDVARRPYALARLRAIRPATPDAAARARSLPSLDARAAGTGRRMRPTSSSSSPSCPRSPSRRCSRSACRPVRRRSRSHASSPAWRISCTGCGESSRLVQFRWQVLDETVDCRCD